MKITTKSSNDRVFSCEYNFGENLDEAVEKFGAEVVFSHFRQNGVIALQGRLRTAMVGTKKAEPATQAELEELVAGFTLKAGAVRKDPVQKQLGMAAKMSAAEREAFIKALQDMQK